MIAAILDAFPTSHLAVVTKNNTNRSERKYTAAPTRLCYYIDAVCN